jgi:hypothetical protein
MRWYLSSNSSDRADQVAATRPSAAEEETAFSDRARFTTQAWCGWIEKIFHLGCETFHKRGAQRRRISCGPRRFRPRQEAAPGAQLELRLHGDPEKAATRTKDLAINDDFFAAFCSILG